MIHNLQKNYLSNVVGIKFSFIFESYGPIFPRLEFITAVEKPALELHVPGCHVPAVSMWCTLSLTPLKREYRRNATLRRCL